jgi:hypothetical protein
MGLALVHNELLTHHMLRLGVIGLIYWKHWNWLIWMCQNTMNLNVVAKDSNRSEIYCYNFQTESYKCIISRPRLKCDGTRTETRLRLWRNGWVHLNRRWCQFSRILAAKVCTSAVVMLDTPCSEVVWRVLATHSIRKFPLHFPCRASSCAITFQLDS